MDFKKTDTAAPRSNTWKASDYLQRSVPHVFLLSTPALIARLYFNGSLFGYHPTFMSIGYMVFLGEGILLAAGAKGRSKDLRLRIHLVCQVTGATLILCGLLTILQNKIQLGKAHFLTLHSRLGLGTLVLTTAALPGGLPDFYGLPPSWLRFRTRVNRLHRRIGRVAYGSALLTIITGLQTFEPAHPLHKGLLTYVCAAGVLGAAIALFGQSGLDRKRLFKRFSLAP